MSWSRQSCNVVLRHNYFNDMNGPLDHIMEVDTLTGAAVSIISTDTNLNSSNLCLKTYTGKTMPISRELDVEVHYAHGSQVYTLSLTVVEGSGPSLLGRDWFCHLTLD